MKLDHHCIWSQNCIGFRNQKAFYLFSVYMSIGIIQFWFTTFKTYHILKADETRSFFSHFEPGDYVLWFITCVSATIIGLMIVLLAISHTFYILTNHTTLMAMKAKRLCPCPFCEGRDIFMNTQDGSVLLRLFR